MAAAAAAATTTTSYTPCARAAWQPLVKELVKNNATMYNYWSCAPAALLYLSRQTRQHSTQHARLGPCCCQPAATLYNTVLQLRRSCSTAA